MLVGLGIAVGAMISGADREEAPQRVVAESPDEALGTESGESSWTTAIVDRAWLRADVELTGEEATDRDGAAAMYSVVRGGPGWVAAGGDGRNGAVWVSEDARSWRRVVSDPSVFQGELMMRLTSVTAGGQGFVAVGWDGFPPAGAESRAVVLTSADGLIWERVPHNPEVFGDREPGDGVTAMQSVVSFGGGLIAVGQAPSSDGHGAAVWTSEDGFSWERIEADSRAFGGPGDQIALSVAVDDGTAVAVGVDAFLQVDHGGPGVWRSSNGEPWRRVDVREHTDTVMEHVVAYSGGFLAVGADYADSDPTVAVWRSDDGTAWSRLNLEDEATHGFLTRLSSSGPELVAVGEDLGSDRASVWISTNGRDWTDIPGPSPGSATDPAQVFFDVEISDDLIVIAGRDADGPAAWVLPPRPEFGS